MRYFTVFITALLITVMLGCAGEAAVNMDNIDEHLGKADVQYVDLRSRDEILDVGMIDGFTMIQFYEDIVQTNMIRVPGNFQFGPDDIVDEASLRELFDEDKSIYLMCRTGVRSQYMYDVLVHLGYESVINIGGYDDYEGSNRDYGDPFE